MSKTLRTVIAIIVVCILSVCALSACAPKQDTTQNNSTVTDLVGREVEIAAGSYQRVVCIGAGALRLYSYIGDVSLLAGVEDIDNLSLSARPKMFDNVARPYVMANQEAFAKLPSCGVGGPNAQNAEAEKILSVNPDIVISEYEDVDKENALQAQLGVPVITVRYGAKGVFDENVSKSLELLGKIFGKETKATALRNYIAQQKEDIFNRTKDVAAADQKSVYICGLGNWGTTNHLMTAQNYEPFAVAHIKNAVSGLANNGIQSIEKEKFVALGDSIDVMIIDAAAVKNIKPLYAEDNAMFDTVKAWQNGEVYLEMAYNAYYTNLEIALANTWYVAKIVYPALFEDVDMTAKTNEITTQFLGANMANDIFACPQSYGGYHKIDTATFFD